MKRGALPDNSSSQDVRLVMEKTGASQQEAQEALAKTGGDVVEALLVLSPSTRSGLSWQQQQQKKSPSSGFSASSASVPGYHHHSNSSSEARTVIGIHGAESARSLYGRTTEKLSFETGLNASRVMDTSVANHHETSFGYEAGLEKIKADVYELKQMVEIASKATLRSQSRPHSLKSDVAPYSTTNNANLSQIDAAKYKTEIEELKRQLSQTAAEREELHSALAETRTAAGKLLELNELLRRSVGLTDTIDINGDEGGDAGTTQTLLRKFQEDSLKLQEEIGRLAEENIKLTNELVSAKEEVSALKAQQEAQLLEHQQQIRALTEQVKSLQQQVQQVQQVQSHHSSQSVLPPSQPQAAIVQVNSQTSQISQNSASFLSQQQQQLQQQEQLLLQQQEHLNQKQQLLQKQQEHALLQAQQAQQIQQIQQIQQQQVHSQPPAHLSTPANILSQPFSLTQIDTPPAFAVNSNNAAAHDTTATRDETSFTLVKANGEKGISFRPQEIEQVIQECIPAVQHAVVFGEGREFIACIVTLKTVNSHNFDLDPSIIAAAASFGSTSTTTYQARSDPKFREFLIKGFMEVNSRLKSQHVVRKFVILPVSLSEQSDEILPNGLLNREKIDTNYASVINGMYNKK